MHSDRISYVEHLRGVRWYPVLACEWWSIDKSAPMSGESQRFQGILEAMTSSLSSCGQLMLPTA